MPCNTPRYFCCSMAVAVCGVRFGFDRRGWSRPWPRVGHAHGAAMGRAWPEQRMPVVHIGHRRRTRGRMAEGEQRGSLRGLPLSCAVLGLHIACFCCFAFATPAPRQPPPIALQLALAWISHRGTRCDPRGVRALSSSAQRGAAPPVAFSACFHSTLPRGRDTHMRAPRARRLCAH